MLAIDGRIAAIGPNLPKGREEIDARGKLSLSPVEEGGDTAPAAESDETADSVATPR